MKKRLTLTCCCLAFTACFAEDPISKLTQRLNSEPGRLSMNGAYPAFVLSSNATSTQVIFRAAEAYRFIARTNNTLRILEIRRVDLDGPLGSPWWAALVEYDARKKVLVFRYVGNDNWWTRFYDLKD